MPKLAGLQWNFTEPLTVRGVGVKIMDDGTTQITLSVKLDDGTGLVVPVFDVPVEYKAVKPVQNRFWGPQQRGVFKNPSEAE